MKKVFWLFAGIILFAAGTPAFAQEAGGGGGMGAANWVAITSGFAMAIASAVLNPIPQMSRQSWYGFVLRTANERSPYWR